MSAHSSHSIENASAASFLFFVHQSASKRSLARLVGLCTGGSGVGMTSIPDALAACQPERWRLSRKELSSAVAFSHDDAFKVDIFYSVVFKDSSH